MAQWFGMTEAGWCGRYGGTQLVGVVNRLVLGRTDTAYAAHNRCLFTPNAHDVAPYSCAVATKAVVNDIWPGYGHSI